MSNSNKLLKTGVLAMMVALGVVISPILRVEGMCPMAHFINIVCSVLLGPWYSLTCALLIGIIRMATMGIPPIALTGAVFGAFLSGVFYRMAKGSIILAVLGEIIGTGIIGAIISFPVMTIFWNKEGLSLLFYVPSFICGTLIGGSIAFAFLKKLSKSGVLSRLQKTLIAKSYEDKGSLWQDAVTIGALGVILFAAISIARSIFSLTAPFWGYFAYGVLIVFAAIAFIYFIAKKLSRGAEKTELKP